MRARTHRHVAALAAERTAQGPVRETIGPAQYREYTPKPLELSWPDYLAMLLHIGAEIEHGLMVEYLYAAYSLGGEGVPKALQPMVQEWRTAILAVAKEEMGHLLSVQNLLTFIGAPICLDREDYPWDSPYYPFPFRLEPLCVESLSCYVYAEKPFNLAGAMRAGKKLPPKYAHYVRHDEKRIEKAVHRGGAKPHPVGEIYEAIVELMGDAERIPDSLFHPETVSRQASWDEWGRNYGPPPRTLDAEGNVLPAAGAPKPPPPSDASTPRVPEAQVIVDQVATRTEALALLRKISGQGEAPHLGKLGEELSHFDRFLQIYQQREKLTDADKTVRNVPVNPKTVPPEQSGKDGTYIESERSRTWAMLFNVRYRMLLTYLAHSFRLARVTRPDEPSLRTGVMHRVFAEMYNLRTIAGLLVSMPLADGKRNAKRAGPPFEMPYSMVLPDEDIDCWRLHQDLLASSSRLIARLRADVSPGGERYLAALRDIDHKSKLWIDGVLKGTRNGRGRP